MILSTATNSFTGISIQIDKWVYGAIPKVYDLILKITEVDIFSADAINGIANRIYMLIGIFMLFKLTFSMISYLVNPDEFSDKTRGFGGLIKNVIVSLILIVAVPYIFSEAYYVQRMILKDNTILYIVMPPSGDNTSDASDAHFAENEGEEIAFHVFSQFVYPNKNIDECDKLYVYTQNEEGKTVKTFNPQCTDAMKANTKKKDDYTLINSYISGLENKNVEKMTDDDIYRIEMNDGSNEKVITYIGLVSAAVGIFFLLLLISFCMDIAVRTIKLAFYQLISPIPIIASIDPKKKNDGMLSKWIKACVGTYLDLFIRLFGFYFMVYIIGLVTNNEIFDSSGWLTLVIIIGALIFAKQLPKIVNDITGLKFEGFTLNPFKKVANEALIPEGAKKPLSKLTLAGAAGLAFGGGATLAKKGLVGLDSKVNGKGFWNGANSVHGKTGNAMLKARETYFPEWAASSKRKAEGKKEVKELHDKWTKGRNIAESLRGVAKENGKTNVFSVLDGISEDGYKKIYKNAEFRNSRMELDALGETQKAYDRIEKASSHGGDFKKAVLSELNNTSAQPYLNIEKLKQIAESGDYNAFAKMYDDNSKAIAGKEKNHESLRKQYSADAQTEDALKYVKYNSTDPTDSSRQYNPNIPENRQQTQQTQQPQQQQQETSVSDLHSRQNDSSQQQSQSQQQQETNVSDLHPRQDDSKQAQTSNSGNSSDKAINEAIMQSLNASLKPYRHLISINDCNKLESLIRDIDNCHSDSERQAKINEFQILLNQAIANSGNTNN